MSRSSHQHVADRVKGLAHQSDQDGDGSDTAGADVGEVQRMVIDQHRMLYVSNTAVKVAAGGSINRLAVLHEYVQNGGYSEPMSAAEFDAQENARQFMAWSAAAALVLLFAFTSLFLQGAVPDLLYGGVGALIAVLGVGSVVTWFTLRE